MNEILTFAIIAMLLVMSPGPNSVLIIKTVGSRGKKAAIENIVGLVFATFVHGAISIFGLSAILVQSAQLFMFVKLIGAAYLLYLGLKTIYATLGNKTEVESHASINEKLSNTSSKNFLEGFFTQILNPKVSMFYLAAFPQFLNFETQNYIGAFTLVSVHAFIILFWFLGLSTFLSRVKSIASNTILGKWVQRLSGCVLVYFSGLLVMQKVNA